MKYMQFYVVLCLVGVVLLGCSEKKETTNITDTYFQMVTPKFNGGVAFETTAFVEQFWRVAGNTGFNKTVYQLVEKLETVGFVEESNATEAAILTYRIEKTAMERPTWEPVDAMLRIQGEVVPLLEYKTNRNMIYQNASSTPAEGVTAEVIYVEKVEDLEKLDVKGKIVYIHASPYRFYKPAIIEGGALGLISYNNPDYLQPEKNVTSIQFRGIPYTEESPAWGIALSYQAKERL